MNDCYVDGILTQMIIASLSAGKVILEHYAKGFDSWSKEDSTPVTNADLEAADIIIRTLSKNCGDCAFLCEETAEALDDSGVPVRMSASRIFIIDPLDGTRSFINGTGQFAVSVSYVESHVAKAAVIYAPVCDKLYYAEHGKGAWRMSGKNFVGELFCGDKLHVSDRENDLILLVGNTDNDPILRKVIEYNSHRISKVIPVSSCIKGCMIAEGSADVHYKFASYTKEWDTSAEELICREAGGIVTDAKGAPLISNRPEIANLKGIRLLNREASALEMPI